MSVACEALRVADVTWGLSANRKDQRSEPRRSPGIRGPAEREGPEKGAAGKGMKVRECESVVTLGGQRRTGFGGERSTASVAADGSISK